MCFKFLIVSVLFYTEVRKILTNISKVKGCEALSEWIQPCVNHLHWCAVTTPSGDGNIILAKFKSFLSHKRDKHTALDDPIFDKYAHTHIINGRKWLKKGRSY